MEFRANAGKVGGYHSGMPLLLLTTTGARSGLQQSRTVREIPIVVITRRDQR